MERFFGKYRGKVENNLDPMMLGRVQVSAPAVLGEGTLSWALPCVPYAGDGVGLFTLPPVGANIWVEFEGGDPNYPIWSGCFWGLGELPVTPALPTTKMFKTDGITITLDDLPGAGGLTIEVEPPVVAMPLKMVFDSSGIEITDDPATVKITPTEIEISLTPATVKLSPSSLDLEHSPSTMSLSPSAVEIGSTPATVKLSASGVELDNAPAGVKLASSGVEISNAGASVKLDAVTVKINDGALEVM